MSFWKKSEIPDDLTIDYDDNLINDDGTRVFLVAGASRPVSGANKSVGGVAYFAGGDTYNSRTDHESDTTNQRTTLLAIEDALKRADAIGLAAVCIMTDSESSVKSLTVLPEHWRSPHGDGVWRNAKRKPVKNQEIMKRCLKLMQGMRVQVSWIRRRDNNIVNRMAKAATHGNTETDY